MTYMIELRGIFRVVMMTCSMFLVCLGCAPTDDSQQQSAQATNGPLASQCEHEDSILGRIECYVKLASNTDDPSMCGQSSHQGVEYQCYAIVAERRRSVEVCHLIPPRSPDHQKLREVCISDVAKTTSNPVLCEEIQTVGLRDSCYVKIGQENGNTALCEKIQDAGLKSICDGEPVIVQ